MLVMLSTLGAGCQQDAETDELFGDDGESGSGDEGATDGVDDTGNADTGGEPGPKDIPASCGNGKLDHEDEDCDAGDFAWKDCQTYGFAGGGLICNADCTVNTDKCGLALCGNRRLEDDEECDGGEADCKELGLGTYGGPVACGSDCRWDREAAECPCVGALDKCYNGDVSKCCPVGFKGITLGICEQLEGADSWDQPVCK